MLFVLHLGSGVDLHLPKLLHAYNCQHHAGSHDLVDSSSVPGVSASVGHMMSFLMLAHFCGADERDVFPAGLLSARAGRMGSEHSAQCFT